MTALLASCGSSADRKRVVLAAPHGAESRRRPRHAAGAVPLEQLDLARRGNPRVQPPRARRRLLPGRTGISRRVPLAPPILTVLMAGVPTWEAADVPTMSTRMR